MVGAGVGGGRRGHGKGIELALPAGSLLVFAPLESILLLPCPEHRLAVLLGGDRGLGSTEALVVAPSAIKPMRQSPVAKTVPLKNRVTRPNNSRSSCQVTTPRGHPADY